MLDFVFEVFRAVVVDAPVFDSSHSFADLLGSEIGGRD